MDKKGMAIDYVALSVLFVVFVVVGIGILIYFSKQAPEPPDRTIYNVTLQCSQLNNSVIDYDEFQTVFYGFLTGQCNGFKATMKGRITVNDIRRISGEWDSTIKTVRINDCSLPSVSSNTVYVNFDEVGVNGIVTMNRRDVRNGDILIC